MVLETELKKAEEDFLDVQIDYWKKVQDSKFNLTILPDDDILFGDPYDADLNECNLEDPCCPFSPLYEVALECVKVHKVGNRYFDARTFEEVFDIVPNETDVDIVPDETDVDVVPDETDVI